MDIEALDLFLAVARQGGFAAVAKERGLDPSSVSRAIAGLEADLGVRLFQRTTRRLALTEAGALYRARIEPLIDDLRRAGAEAASASSTPAGTLRLTASTAFGITCVTPLLPAFRAAFPQLKLECVFTDANLDLVAERIDLAIRLAPAIDGDLIAVKLMDTRYRVVASPGYRASAPPLLRPADLAAHRCLLLDIRSLRRAWRFRMPDGDEADIPVDGDVSISSPLGVRSAALAGLGPALLPNWLIGEDLAAGRLVDVLPEVEVTPTTFATGAWALYPSRAYLPMKVRVAIDFLKRAFAEKR